MTYISSLGKISCLRHPWKPGSAGRFQCSGLPLAKASKSESGVCLLFGIAGRAFLAFSGMSQASVTALWPKEPPGYARCPLPTGFTAQPPPTLKELGTTLLAEAFSSDLPLLTVVPGAQEMCRMSWKAACGISLQSPEVYQPSVCSKTAVGVVAKLTQ